MSIILTRNFRGAAADDFAAEVRRRAAINSQSGTYDFVYVVPTRRRVRELQRELVGEIVVGKLPIYTLELFVRELFAELRTAKRIISRSTQGMMISEILAGDDYKFFKYLSFVPGGRKGVAPVGTIKKVVDQIDYLRENGLLSEDYRKMLIAVEDSERRKLEEFVRIYEEYEKDLDSDKLIDGAGLLPLVNHEIETHAEFIEKNFQKDLTFFVEGFYNFKKPELELLKILASHKRFAFLIKLDCVDTNTNLFKTMLGTASELEARGFKRLLTGTHDATGRELKEKVGSKKQEIIIAKSDGELREYFASHLFGEEPVKEKLGLRGKVFVAAVRDKLREVEFAAEKIKEIMENDPSQELDRICVASYLPQDYSQIVKEVFAKYRIPANVTDRFTLESNRVVNAVLSFIDIRLADYERSALLRAITNQFLVVTDKFSPGKAGGTILKAAALCRFERGLKGFKEMLTHRVAVFSRIDTGDQGDDAIQIRRNIETLEQARAILDSVEEKLSQFRNEMRPSEFRSAAKTLLRTLKVYDQIANLNVANVAVEVVEQDARALSAFSDVIDEVVELEIEKGNKKIGFDNWIDKLRSALSLTRYNVRQKYGYGVYVTALEEIRGLEFDYMFIMGLNEGELPTKYSPEIFLPLALQKENRHMQPYLQRHLFYQAASSFKKELYLVHAQRSDDARLARSSFIDAIQDVGDCTTIDDAGVERRDANIYNIQQAIGAYDDELDGTLRGATHFLPPNLRRCKEADLARYANDRKSKYHGTLTGRSSLELISAQITGKIFSAAQLESLSRCGFQFFVRRVLGIADVPDIETSLGAIERGAVLHKILFQFYTELAASGKLETAKDELKLLLEIGERALDALGIKQDLFEVERGIILGDSDVKGTLELFLEKVQSTLSNYGFHAQVFELGFGMRAGEDVIPPVKIGDILLRGKIDRIDHGTDGFTIFDYKSSSTLPGHVDVVRDKISPQLILYLYAMDQLIKRKYLNLANTSTEVRASATGFISINRDKLNAESDGKDLINFIVQSDGVEIKYGRTFGGGRTTRATEKYPRTLNELMSETEEFFNRKVLEARMGRFNLTDFPYERVCKFCDYSEACRIALKGESAVGEESA